MMWCFINLTTKATMSNKMSWCHAPQPFPPSRDPFPFQMHHDRPLPYVPTPTEASLALSEPSLARYPIGQPCITYELLGTLLGSSSPRHTPSDHLPAHVRTPSSSLLTRIATRDLSSPCNEPDRVSLLITEPSPSLAQPLYPNSLDETSFPYLALHPLPLQ